MLCFWKFCYVLQHCLNLKLFGSIESRCQKHKGCLMDTVGLKIEQKFAIVFESLDMFLKVLLYCIMLCFVMFFYVVFFNFVMCCYVFEKKNVFENYCHVLFCPVLFCFLWYFLFCFLMLCFLFFSYLIIPFWHKAISLSVHLWSFHCLSGPSILTQSSPAFASLDKIFC